MKIFKILPLFLTAILLFITCDESVTVDNELKTAPKLTFTKLTVDKQDVTKEQLLQQIQEKEKEGFTIKNITISDPAFAEVKGTAPDFSLTLKKAGTFTIKLTLQKSGFKDITIEAIIEYLITESLTFDKLTTSKNTLTKEDLLKQVQGKKEGFTIKNITIRDDSFADIDKTNFSLKIKKDGTFKIILILQKNGFKDVTIEAIIIYLITAEAEKVQRKELKKRWNDLMVKYYDGSFPMADVTKHYTEQPSVKVPYRLGRYTDKYTNFMYDWWNFYKVATGGNVERRRTEDEQRAQASSLYFCIVKKIGHYTDKLGGKLSGMTDDFYGKTKQGASSSNLFAADSRYWYHEAIQFNFTEGKVKDEGDIRVPSIGYMGHRWNGLSKNNASVGIGYRHLNGYNSVVWRRIYVEQKDSKRDYSAFPYGYYPIQIEMAKKTNNS